MGWGEFWQLWNATHVDGNSLPALITITIFAVLVGLEQPHVLTGAAWCSPSFFPYPQTICRAGSCICHCHCQLEAASCLIPSSPRCSFHGV